MKKTAFIAIALGLGFSSPAAEPPVKLNLYFGYDLYNLTEDHVEELQDYLEKFGCDSIQVTITGHTDNHASDDYNLELAENRCNSVIRGLTDQGISKVSIVSVPNGEFIPVASNDVDEGRALNRRVEVEVTYCSSGPTGEQALRELLLSEPQLETVWTGANQTIELEKGTLLHVPKDAFRMPNGDSIGSAWVDLYIDEVVDLEDMMRYNTVTSTHDGQLLQTGGMIRVVAMVGDDTLTTVNPLIADFPIDLEYDDYQAFQQVNNSNDTHAGITWGNPSEAISTAFMVRDIGVRLLGRPYMSFAQHIGRIAQLKSWHKPYRIRFVRINRGDRNYHFNGVTYSPDTLRELRSHYDVRSILDVQNRIFEEAMVENGFENPEEFYQYLLDNATEMSFDVGEFNSDSQTLPVLGGWANLDRFYKMDPSMIARARVRFAPGSGRPGPTYLIMPSTGICIPVQGNIATPLEVGLKVQIVSMKLHNGQLLVASASFIAGDIDEVNLEYEGIEAAELGNYLNNLSDARRLASN